MFIDQLYQDYLRQLEEARRLMLNELMIKRAAGSDDGVKSVLDAICRRTTGIPLEVVRHTSPERLWDLIHSSGHSNFNSILVAELLLQDVELSDKIGNIQQGMVSRLQAFCLLVDSMKLLAPKEQAEYRKKLDTLAANLESLGNDPYVRGKVDSYRSSRAFFNNSSQTPPAARSSLR